MEAYLRPMMRQRSQSQQINTKNGSFQIGVLFEKIPINQASMDRAISRSFLFPQTKLTRIDLSKSAS